MSSKQRKKARTPRPSSGVPGRRTVPRPANSSSRRSRRSVWPGLYVGLAAVFIVTIAIVLVVITTSTWQPADGDEPAMAVVNIADAQVIDQASLTRNHKDGKLTYGQTPPVGGDHNPSWQNCTGAVYTAPIANEHAVHSLEHGAVWVTYRPDLPADQVQALAAKIRGVDYTFLSPFASLDKPISVQAWGYQLKLDSPSDPRLDAFITATRITAAPEPGATCTGGVTVTGTTPQGGGGMPQRS